MERVKLEVGDTAWVHGPNGRGEGEFNLVPYPVVHKFERYGMDQYVVEIDTPVDPVLSVYNSMTVSDSVDRPIGFYRGWGDPFKKEEQ
jgi:hypothetical protein